MNQLRPFKFLRPDGEIETNTDIDYLKEIGLSEEEIKERKAQEKAHYLSEMYFERKWRNNELNLTDRLVLPDSTFNGVPVSECFYFEEIMNYRKSLQEYDLIYGERPERPSWFIEK